VDHPLRTAVAAVVLARAAAGLRRREPLPVPAAVEARVSVLVPAADGAAGLAERLSGVAGAPGVAEVLVLDPAGSEAVAAAARDAGARLVAVQAPPPDRVAAPWALEQGLQAARGEVVVALGPAVVASPGLVGALVGELRRREAEGRRPVLLSAAGRRVVAGRGDRLVAPAFQAAGRPAGDPLPAGREPQPRRATVWGPLLCARARPLREAGGFALAAGHRTHGVALARALAGRGWLVAGCDAGDLATEAEPPADWRERARAVVPPDVTPGPGRALHATALAALRVWPWVRVLRGRADAADGALLVARGLLLAGQARGWGRVPGPDPLWCSWLLDGPVAVAVALAAAGRGRGQAPSAPGPPSAR
jgi:dolichol-phosphate mannosyltransferase